MSHYILLAGLELTEICLPLPPNCWDFKACATMPYGKFKVHFDGGSSIYVHQKFEKS